MRRSSGWFQPPAGMRRMAVVTLALLSLSMPAQAAFAQNIRYNQCSAQGGTMYMTLYYTISNSYSWADRADFTIDNSTHQNNVYLRYRAYGGSFTYWAWTSGDDISGGRTYSHYPNTPAPLAGTPYMKYSATFDRPGVPDESCHEYIYATT